MKAYALAEDENYWSGFLIDENCQSETVERYFPGQVASGRDDPSIVAEARDGCRTIVTSNEKDFIRYVREAQKIDNQQRCEDCWGLIVLPNNDLVRAYALEKAGIKRGVKLGGVTLPWKAVGYANLFIGVKKDGRLQIRRFERCQFCRRDAPIRESWYAALKML